jgi:hypothetical protein
VGSFVLYNLENKVNEIDGHVDKYEIHNTVLRKREFPREEEGVII